MLSPIMHFRTCSRKIKFKTMRRILFCAILLIVLGYQNIQGQYNFVTPPSVKKINYADRELTFSDVTINGQETTYLAVEKGATVKIKTRIQSKRIGDYCPGCIVQIYWGIRDYTSVCAKSFGGYRFTKKKSKHTFKAPMKDGIYYITMGGTLEYSCKNNNQRPRCAAEYAFAVLKVGNPDLEKKITLVKEKRDSGVFLKTTLVKSGPFGDLDKIEWFFEGEKLDYDDQEEIHITEFGRYKALWSNCLDSIANSFNYTLNDEEVIPPKVEQDSTLRDSTDLAVLIENNDKFVLKNLIFDLNKSNIRPEAQMELDKLAQIMKDKPSMKILLEGHTALGNARKNRVLSEQRVKSTKEYLVEQGVMINNIATKGWGQQKPLIRTRDIKKGKINRRVEIQILSR